MVLKKYVFIISVFILSACKNDKVETIAENTSDKNSSHPSLILTKEGVKNIRAKLGAIPLFDKTLEAVKQEVDAEINAGIEIPIPKDFSGGGTHTSNTKKTF